MHPHFFSVVIPVHNEARLVPQTVQSVLQAIAHAARAGYEAEIAYVCNGCTDGSASIVRRLVADVGRVEVLEISRASKIAALNAGDQVLTCFPRFYIDADVIVSEDLFVVLLPYLSVDGALQLVSPQISLDVRGASHAARYISQVWLQLPHNREEAFHHVLGLSEAGRSRWREFPEIMADDAFITSQIAPERRGVVREATITTWAPHSFWAWVRVRARWARGHHELVLHGIQPPSTPGQKTALAKLLLHRQTAVPAIVYVVCRLLSAFYSRIPGTSDQWYSPRN